MVPTRASRNLKQKKLFLFSAERMELSFERLAHYTGTDPALFQRHVLLTNYGMHMGEAFLERFPDAAVARPGVQMPAYHSVGEAGSGVSLVNIGVGPSNAKTLTDHVAVLRPDLLLMIGHCGGLRNHQEIGDFVLARTFLRADSVLDLALARHIPVHLQPPREPGAVRHARPPRPPVPLRRGVHDGRSQLGAAPRDGHGDSGQPGGGGGAWSATVAADGFRGTRIRTPRCCASATSR